MRTKVPSLIVIIAIIVLILIVTFGFIYRLRQISRNLPAILENEVESALNRAVRIDTVRIQYPSTVVVRGVSIADGRTFTSGTLLTVDRTIIRFDPVGLIFGGTLTRNLKSITIIDPRLRLVRDRQGNWNIEDLLRRPPVPAAERFRGTVHIMQGRLTVNDYAAKLPNLPARNTLSSIRGSMNFAPAQYFMINLEGTGDEERVGRLTAFGRWGISDPATRLLLDIQNANAAYWLNYFTDIRTWNINRGTFDGRAILSQPRGTDIHTSASVQLREAQITSPYLAIPISDFTSSFTFVDTNIRIAGQGLLRRSPITVQGRIEGFQQTRLNLRVSSERIDIGTLQTAIRPLPALPLTRWTVPGAFSATITGLASNPVVTGSASVPRAVIYSTPVTRLALSGFYRDGTIRITTANALAAGGRIDLTANIALRPVQISILGTTSGVRASAIPVLQRAGIAGTTDARFNIDYTNQLQAANITASISRGRIETISFTRGSMNIRFTGPGSATALLRINQGSAPGISFQTASADLSLRGRQIIFRQIRVDAYRGQILASGTATLDRALNLRINADNINLQVLLQPLGYRDVSGIADFTGNLTGTVDNPRLEGQLTAINGRIRQIDFQFLSGRLIATKQQLVLENVAIRSPGGNVATTGVIIIAGREQPRFDLMLSGRDVNLQQVLRIIGLPVRATGAASADLQITGRLPDLQLSGDISIRDANIAGIRVDAAIARFQSVEGRTLIREFSARRGDMVVSGQGFIGTGGQLNIDVIGQNLNLSLFNDTLYPYVTLDGPMTFSGEVRGVLSRPVIRGTFASTGPRVNQQQFESLVANMSWDGVRIAFSDGVLLGQGARYALPLIRFNPTARFVEMEASVASGSLSGVTGILRNSPILGLPQGNRLREYLSTIPNPFTGTFNASLRLSGPIGNLAGTANITAAGVQMGSSAINLAEFDFVAQRSAFRLQRVAVSSPEVRFAATAQFVNALPTQFAASITDTQVSALRDLLLNAPFLPAFEFGRGLIAQVRNIPTPASGVLNSTVSIANIQTSPTARLSLSAQNLILSGETLGDITANAALADNIVIIEQLNLAQPQGQASIQGTVNLEGMISITGQGSQLSLAALRPFLNLPVLEGNVDFNLIATGSIDNPNIQTSFTASNVRTQQASIDQISADRLVIAGNRLTTDRLLVQNNGSQVVLSGSVPFTWRTPFIPRDQPLLVNGILEDQDFSIASTFSRLVEASSGTLSGNIQIRGTLNEPDLGGEITLQNGTLNLRNVQNDFTDINARTRFSGSTLIIDTLSGSSSLGGNFSAEGNVTLTDIATGSTNLLVSLSDLRLDVTNITSLGGDATLTSNGQLTVSGSIASPLVQGQLVVRNADIEIPATAVPTSVQIPTLPINPQLQVTLNLTQDVNIERGALSAEIVGPVTIAGTLNQPVLSGTVQITDGELRYAGRSLEIASGGIASFLIRPPLPATITVSMEARTRVTAPSPITGRLTRFTIVMDISGPIGNLDIDVRSSPPGLSEAEALRYAFGGVALEALVRGQTFEQVFQQQFGQILVGFVLPGIFEPLELGAISLALEPGFDIPLQVTATVPLTERVLLSYSRSVIGVLPVNTLSVSYTISQQLALTVEFEGANGPNNETIYLIEYFTRF